MLRHGRADRPEAEEGNGGHGTGKLVERRGEG
jgi:hypothetical protein